MASTTTTNSNSKYTFLSWIKTGIGAEITTNESDLTTPRPQIGINLTIERKSATDASSDSLIVTKNMEIYGPGDIVGILNKIVVRTEPKANESNVDPNHFIHIEFSEADFPWRYTPAMPYTAGVLQGQLRPWISLIILKENEFRRISDANGVLPQISITDPTSSLPNLDQAWAWAHCKVAADFKDDVYDDIEKFKEALKNILNSQPHKAVSRLLCARKLESNAKYFAFVVPTFEVGRRAGINQDIPDNLKGTEAAWTVNSTGSITIGSSSSTTESEPPLLPIYYQWEFTTGEAENFEYLVRKIKTRDLSETNAGLRDLDVSTPFFDSQIVTGITKTLGLPSALWAPGTKKYYESTLKINVQDYANQPEEIKKFIMSLKAFLDLPLKLSWKYVRNSSDQDPVICLPIYGKWQANKKMISKISPDFQDPEWIGDLYYHEPATTDPQLVEQWNEMKKIIEGLQKNHVPYLWMEELNLDPANRIAAGIGAYIVQQEQEDLMAAAWDQVGAVKEANKLLRFAQFSKTVSKNVFERSITKMNNDVMTILVAPVHNKIYDTTEKHFVSQTLKEHPIPSAFFSSSFRQITSPRGSIHRKLFENSNINVHFSAGLLGQFNKRLSNKDPKPSTPDDLLSIDRIIPLFYPDVNDPRHNITESSIHNSSIGDPNVEDGENNIPPHDSITLEEGKHGEDPHDPTALEFYDDIKNELDPDTVIDTKIIPLEINRPPRLDEDNDKKDKLDQILAYPKFKHPMFEALRDISQDLLLAGVGDIPQNTKSILVTNDSFVNSYLAGLNHEMARELLWREYPTDQRGTYFRQFWDPTISIEKERLNELMNTTGDINGTLSADKEEEIVEKYYDIKPIHLWKKDSGIEDCAQNDDGGRTSTTPTSFTSRSSASSVVSTDAASVDDKPVFLIKGDLLRRYPTTIIYASKAQLSNDASKPWRLKDPEEVKQPVFRGTINPDITFFGFDIHTQTLKGNPTPDPNDPGYFIVIQQQPFEPLFALDYTTTTDPNGNLTGWDNLGWDWVGLSPSKYIDFDAEGKNASGEPGTLKGTKFEDIEWMLNAANMAYITLREPIKYAEHANEMLQDM